MAKLKFLLPASAFVILPILGYYSASTSMENTDFDDDFYRNLFLSNSFLKKENDLKEGIDFDDLNVRDYFFNDSFNLIWRNKDKEKKSIVSANSFLLNVLLPDWITEHHSDFKNYVPKKNYGGDEVVLLLGTTFSFVNKLFNKEISNWNKDVNESDTSVSLKDKSSDSTTHEFLFSHPWPSSNNESIRLSQDYIYTLENEKFTSFDYDVNKPYFFGIDSKDVELIYAATDLSVNSDLLNIDAQKNIQSLVNLKKLHDRNNKNVNWINKIKSPTGEEYKFFVDFAVLKVKFPIANLNGQFLDYLINVYKKKNILPPILSSNFSIKNNRVGPVYLGGWNSMLEHEKDIYTMENLLLKADVKQDGISTKKPSDCYANPTNCFEFKLYETFSSRFSNDQPSASQTYDVVSISCTPNDVDGILFCKYRIKNKTSQLETNIPKEIIISGFKTSGNSYNSELLKNYDEEKLLSDVRLIDFLEAKPKAHAKWKEYKVQSSYFPFQNIQNHFLSKLLTKKINGDGFLKLNGSEYFNISHHLEIPNMSLNNAQGMVAVMRHRGSSNLALLGIYDGEKKWKNPMTGFYKDVGRVTMFLSPFRYDLFNFNNNLSKPSLADSLKKKKLDSKIIQTRRFRI